MKVNLYFFIFEIDVSQETVPNLKQIEATIRLPFFILQKQRKFLSQNHSDSEAQNLVKAQGAVQVEAVGFLTGPKTNEQVNSSFSEKYKFIISYTNSL